MIDDTLRVTIPGEPVAQGRGRAVRMGKGVRVVDPTRARNWKATAAEHIRIAMIQQHHQMMAGPLRVVIRCYWACPRSKCLKTKPRPAEWRPKRPDADNLAKAVLDAATDVIWWDDAQVVHLTVEKWQADQAEPARVELAVEEINP